MAVTLSALRYLPGPDIGPELLRSARFYDSVIRGGVMGSIGVPSKNVVVD